VDNYNVILVDDDPHIRQHMSAVLATEPRLNLVACAETLAEGLALLEKAPPRVLLVDLGLPDGSGLDLIAAASQHPQTDSMVISVFGDEQNVISALKFGATGYLLKDGMANTIIDDILSLIAGGSPISAKIARHLLNRFQEPQTPQVPTSTLTQRQIEVLKLVSMGYKRREIAERLFVSVDTIGTHILHIYKKLRVNTNVEAIKKGSDLGLL